MGSIRALREAGLRVPEEVSVVGFDDIESAAFQSPGLTTVRQPLRKMGRMAAQVILRRIGRPDEKFDGEPFQLVVEPELIIRGTTAAVPRRKSPRKLILLHQS
jgi:DNA-binding LacI/PurR family transcriptional regulator